MKVVQAFLTAALLASLVVMTMNAVPYVKGVLQPSEYLHLFYTSSPMWLGILYAGSGFLLIITVVYRVVASEVNNGK